MRFSPSEATWAHFCSFLIFSLPLLSLSSQMNPNECTDRIIFEQTCTPIHGSDDVRCVANYKKFAECLNQDPRLEDSESWTWTTKRSWSEHLKKQALEHLPVAELKHAWKDIRETEEFIKNKVTNFGNKN